MAAAVAMVTFVPRPMAEQPATGSRAGRRHHRARRGHRRPADGRVAAIEPLARGERLRIGYQPGDHRYLLSLSIDDRGEVHALYPEQGPSLTVPDGSQSATRFLPDSWELTGKGDERIIVVLSDQPIDVETARRAARAAYQKAGGNLARMPNLELPGEQFVRTFAKP